MTDDADEVKVEQLSRLGVSLEIVGDVMTLRFANDTSEDWLAVSPAMLELDAWKRYESIRFGGRAWVKVEGGLS